MSWIKRVKSLFFALAIIGFCSAAYLRAAEAQQPLFVYLIASVTDHVNMDLSEDRLRHILPMVDRLRQQHPESHVSAVVLFSGAISQALQERNASTHILDFVKDYVHRGVIEVGYDGADEPTYEHRPTVNILTEPSPQGRWKDRRIVAAQFLAEARDPLTGAPASGDGGLKKMQEVFGKAAYIQGLELAAQTSRPPQKVVPPPGAQGAPPPGATFAPKRGVFKEWGGDTETLQMLRPYNSSAIMFGIPSSNPAQFAGFSEMVTHFGLIMSPAPDTAPEVYWQDSVLRLSQAALPVRMVKAQQGTDALKNVLNDADRSKVHVVEVELGSTADYLQDSFLKTAPNGPLQYAYDHPQSPKLPADALRPDADVAAGWAKEEALLKWLIDDDFKANPRDRFLSNAELAKMAGSPNGFSVSTQALTAAASDALKQVGIGTFLFSYVRVEDHYLSLAELFQVMTDALAEYHRTGKLPQTVKVAKVYGPVRVVTGHGPNIGELTAGDLEAFCESTSGSLHDETTDASGVPNNSIPPVVTLNGMDLNPSQLIRLMIQALANPAPETKLAVRMSYVEPAAGVQLPTTRPVFDIGFVWTLKPALLSVGN